MTTRARPRFIPLLLAAGALLLPFRTATAQNANFIRPVAEIESRLRSEEFTILDWRGSRMPEDRTQRVLLQFADSTLLLTKWASAPRGGGRFNNQPRYEAAAYEIQKLFLDELDYVVPPTVIRAFPLDFVATQVPDQRATFGEAPASVVVALQYWMHQVHPQDFWQPQRVRTDTLYARRIGNFNVLTHLINHKDSNSGNYLISGNPADPHVYSVDNGVSFESEPSNRGEEWKEMRVDRLPGAVVQRLEQITREDLERALGVLAEFTITEGALVPVDLGENLDRNRGVRVKDGRVQFGLTTREIRAVERRLNQLVRDANGRRYKIF
ncbi:MAG TPA: hypothetical protein VFZ69_12920 [Longimicrobiales bacterium]